MDTVDISLYVSAKMDRRDLIKSVIPWHAITQPIKPVAKNSKFGQGSKRISIPLSNVDGAIENVRLIYEAFTDLITITRLKGEPITDFHLVVDGLESTQFPALSWFQNHKCVWLVEKGRITQKHKILFKGLSKSKEAGE